MKTHIIALTATLLVGCSEKQPVDQTDKPRGNPWGTGKYSLQLGSVPETNFLEFTYLTDSNGGWRMPTAGSVVKPEVTTWTNPAGVVFWVVSWPTEKIGGL